jgi:F0F1-type ATP synthase membrane subunit b/b'
VRLHDPLLAAIDRYRTTIGEEITRAEALRQLAAIALGDMKPKKKKK